MMGPSVLSAADRTRFVTTWRGAPVRALGSFEPKSASGRLLP